MIQPRKFIDSEGYVRRITTRCRRSSKGGEKSAASRNWWLVKHRSHGPNGSLEVGVIAIDEKYVGKRIRLKMEVVE